MRRGLSSPSKNGVQVKQKPSLRKTIESMVSTGSQSEYFKAEQTIIIFDWNVTHQPQSRAACSGFLTPGGVSTGGNQRASKEAEGPKEASYRHISETPQAMVHGRTYF